ncbi:MAG: hypothetical protein LC772_02645 [Chloroflexi bacterium]|nr:hypothetical protein [Chloroflexota bacterium]
MAHIELCVLRTQLDSALEESASLMVLLERSRVEPAGADVVAILERRIDELDRKARQLFLLAQAYGAPVA